MKISPLSVPLALSAALALPTLAQDATGQRNPAADFAALEAAQNTANAKAGPRIVPGRSIPVPSTASPELQASIAGPYRVPAWNANPKTAAEWKEEWAIPSRRPHEGRDCRAAEVQRTSENAPRWPA